MRKIILYIIMGFMLVIVVFSSITVHGRGARKDEIEQGLSEAIEATIHALFEKQSYSFSGRDEFVADFLQGLLLNLKSTSEITINILAADEEKGLLSVEVLETYQHINGKTGMVSAYRTVLFDTMKKEDTNNCNIYLYLSKSDVESEDGTYKKCYKICTVVEGSNFTQPKSPSLEGKVFKEWCTLDGIVIDNSFVINDDIFAYAVYE